mmetsp:Transcript_10908/g.31527  ORF Transcript_10908/g.31527 Transcript_10908/m.31527 type:complete len:205 (+) Transcript_10908:273-887(+)
MALVVLHDKFAPLPYAGVEVAAPLGLLGIALGFGRPQGPSAIRDNLRQMRCARGRLLLALMPAALLVLLILGVVPVAVFAADNRAPRDMWQGRQTRALAQLPVRAAMEAPEALETLGQELELHVTLVLQRCEACGHVVGYTGSGPPAGGMGLGLPEGHAAARKALQQWVRLRGRALPISRRPIGRRGCAPPRSREAQLRPPPRR